MKPSFKAQNVNLYELETGCYVVGNKIIRCETFNYPSPPTGLSEAQAGWAYKVDDNPTCSTAHVADELERWTQTSHLRDELNRMLGS